MGSLIASLSAVASVLPIQGGWADDGAWANSTAMITPHGSDAGASVASAGFAQVVLPLPSMDSGGVYRLGVKAVCSGQIENVSVRVRKRGLPYTVFAARDFAIQEGHLDVDLQFKTPGAAAASEFGLFLMVTGAGVVDVSGVSLKRIPSFEIVGNQGAPRGQLISNKDFALGSAGWVLRNASIAGGDSDGLVLAVDQKGRGTATQEVPVVLELGRTYRLTVAGQAIRGLRVELRGDKREVFRRFEVGAGEEGCWSTRFSLVPPESGVLRERIPTVFELSAEAGQARVSLIGLEEIDEECGEGVVRRGLEAHVGFEIEGREVPRVCVGEKVSLVLRVAGLPSGAHVSAKVRDWEGTVVHEVVRAVGTLPDGTLGFEEPNVLLPSGWFDTEVSQAGHEGGVMPVVPGEIAVLAKVPSRAEGNEWVLGHHLQYWDAKGGREGLSADAGSVLEQARAIGIGSVRFHPPMATKWWSVEPERGHWTFSDEIIDAPVEQGIAVLGSLDGTPKFASSAPAAQMAAAKGWPRNWAVYPAANMDDWRTYVRTMVGRYRTRVRAWEIWNEPDSRMFLGMPATAGDGATRESVYVELVKAAAQEIRAIDPDIVIVAGAVTAGGRDFLVRSLREYELAKFCDVVSFHGYGRVRTADRGGASFEDMVAAIRSAAGRPVPVWDTEASLGVMPEGRGGLRAAEAELKGIMARRAAGITRLYFYNGFSRSDPLHGDFRVLWGYDDRRPLAIQPLLAASQCMLGTARFEKILADEPDGAHVYVFRRANGIRVAAGWTSSATGQSHFLGGGEFSSGRVYAQTGADLGPFRGGELPLVSSVRYFVSGP